MTRLEENSEHHHWTSGAMNHSQRLSDSEDQDRAQVDSPETSHEARSGIALYRAREHGKAARKLLDAARQQHRAGNHGIAKDLFSKADHHEKKRDTWHDEHLDHEGRHIAQHFLTHSDSPEGEKVRVSKPHREVHFDQIRTPEEVDRSSHPYDVHRKWEHMAKIQSAIANSIPPWDPRFEPGHEKAAIGWDMARRAATNAAEVTGQIPGEEDPVSGGQAEPIPTEDYLHYAKLAKFADRNYHHHRRKQHNT